MNHHLGASASLLVVVSVLGPGLAGCASGSGAGPEDPRPAAVPPAAAEVSGRTTATYRAAGPDGREPGRARMRRAADMLKARAVAFGLEGTAVAVRGATIAVTASGDTADTLRQIAVTGAVAFRPVLDPAAVPTALRERYEALDCDAADPADAPAHAGPRLPAVACHRDEPAGSAEKLVLGPVVLDGADVRGATAAAGAAAGGWGVELELTAGGRAALCAVTAGLAGRAAPADRLGFLMDGTVLSAPVVAGKVTTGTTRIGGGFTRASARNLAALLRAGALPVRLTLAGVTTRS